MRGGQPLKFLLVVLAGWTGARAALLWPGAPLAVPAAASASLPAMADTLPTTRPLAARALAGISADAAVPPYAGTDPEVTLLTAQDLVAEAPPPPPGTTPTLGLAEPLTILAAAADPPRTPVPAPAPATSSPPPAQNAAPVEPALVPRPPGPGRWSASAWAVVRGGSMAGNGVFGPAQLGGSQAGARIRYALARTLSLSGRLSTPLKGIGREAGLGFEWQPLTSPIPLSFLLERRFALDSGPGGTALGAITGINPTRVYGPLELEGYGQAGVVVRNRRELYADGALRLLYPLVEDRRFRLSLGAGTWGGAQRGARRLDVGPAVVATVPTGGPTLRVAAEWRQRVAGNAAPGSGPALTLGTDF
ncbi:hypothetical protein LK533_12680 [Sphingomonas sp. PL-96]|uniref:hypothetical protein n=1 Tax=Sphingomonas sp. PL-96 TaxID=2887201 RepID=UPI001E2FDE0F|nr:hypothetical protein [Sphingomonas sp. PL-96]MCC2977527.1 hypothetical protein [Sphingomonas sp. PL-96]